MLPFLASHDTELQNLSMTHVTFTKEIDGATLTLTIYRNEGETMQAFGTRARAEWTAFLAGWGQ